MSKCKISGKVLAIQLGREETQIVLVNGSEILYGAAVPTPAGAVDDGVIRNPDALRDMLKTALKAPEFRRIHQAVFSLCTSQVITETVTVPDLPASKLEKLLRANADMYFPVDTQDYQLVWETIGPKVGDGSLKELAVQLWAVPTAILTQYYSVANACGLSVAAIDYCGHSIATAAGASFARSGKAAKEHKKLSLNTEISFGSKKKVEPADDSAVATETRRAQNTDLHLLLDKDLLGMTFVQNGQVVLQRLIRCGSHPSYQFGELAMMLEYFRSLDIGRGSTIRGVVSGCYAMDKRMVNDLEDMLGINLTAFNASYDLGWVLCVGAARTVLDFGVPTLNSPSKARKQVQTQIWQYGLVLAGALAVLAVILMTLTSRLTWDSEIQNLENTRQLLTIQQQKTAGYADNYYEYENMYDAYSSDWETVFGSLQAYNDNLVLVMDELETILPENSSVTNMQIASNGLNVVFACEDKEEAAYLIMALREMQYADLVTVSDLSGGGSGPATTYGSGEAPPTEGSSVSSLITTGLDKDKLLEVAKTMDSDDIATLEKAYGKIPDTENEKISDLVTDETRAELFEKRGAALEEMLTTNPFALNHFSDMLVEDFNKGADTVLWWYIIDDVIRWKNDGTISGDMSDPEAMMELMNQLIEVLTADEETLAATEALLCAEYEDGVLCSEDEMELTYIHYLEVQMELREEEDFPYLNITKVATDVLLHGGFNTGDPELDAKLNTLIPDLPELPDIGGSDPTDPTDPSDPTDPTNPTDPTDPSTPGSIFTEEMIVKFFKAYLKNGGTDIDAVDTMIEDFLAEGTTGYPELDSAINAYIGGGFVDAEVAYLLDKYEQEGGTGVDAFDAVIEKYKAGEGTGIAVLDTLFDTYYENKTEDTKPTDPEETVPTDPTDPEETDPSDPADPTEPGDIFTDEMIEQYLKDYLDDGKTEPAWIGEMIDKYFQEGSTGVDDLDQMIEDYIRSGKANAELEKLMMNYVLNGSTGIDALDELIRKYQDEGTTGNDALDEIIDGYLGGSDTEKLGTYLKLYLTYGTTGIADKTALIEKYITTGTTGDEESDEVLSEYINGGNVSNELKGLLYMYLYKRTSLNGYDAILTMFDNYFEGDGTGSDALDEQIKNCLKVIAEEALKNATSNSGSNANKNSGSGAKAAVTDTRVYFAAVLGYNDELKNAELDRKGLSYEDKIEKLEVEEG